MLLQQKIEFKLKIYKYINKFKIDNNFVSTLVAHVCVYNYVMILCLTLYIE